MHMVNTFKLIMIYMIMRDIINFFKLEIIKVKKWGKIPVQIVKLMIKTKKEKNSLDYGEIMISEIKSRINLN